MSEKVKVLLSTWMTASEAVTEINYSELRDWRNDGSFGLRKHADAIKNKAPSR